ncbi:hypothetical protein K438DRAFT_1945581 [Mycena galopus ATCC 62051]|nr:hypothetical protein K438DRAFT_1945581 [Mycena galopus ATCC 62051]
MAVDCGLTEATNMSIDEAALTGKSPPQSKSSGTSVFSPHSLSGDGDTRIACWPFILENIILENGEAEGVDISTSANMFFGRAASLVGQPKWEGLQQDEAPRVSGSGHGEGVDVGVAETPTTRCRVASGRGVCLTLKLRLELLD